MKLTPAELEFLSAWAKEEQEPACYQAPAHQLQLAHNISGALLIDFIKAWTFTEGKKDLEILQAASNPTPGWPWASSEEFQHRLEEAKKVRVRASMPARLQ